MTNLKISSRILKILTPLISAGVMIHMSGSMFVVAVPTIRTLFHLNADTASWLHIAHNLPFLAFIPLCGKLSDIFGKKNLFFFSLISYLVGTVLLLSSSSLSVILFARVIMGTGTGGIIPLSMAVVSEHADSIEKGKALGAWNCSGPVSGMLGPLVAGFIISAYKWQSIMWIVLFLGIVSLFLFIPLIPKDSFRRKRSLKAAFSSFDWAGVFLFNGSIIFLVFFTSSRPITGRAPLTDFRLLTGLAIFTISFILYERKKSNPFIDFSFIQDKSLSWASISVCTRMITLGGVFLVIPLMLTDLYGFSPTKTGITLVFHSAAMLFFTQIGGSLIDRWGHRFQITIGLLFQSIAMLLFLFFLGSMSLFSLSIVIVLHGIGAGLSIAALHLYALSGASAEASAIKAGIYSTIRYSGRLIGAAIGGIILQFGLDRYGITPSAYVPVFMFYSAITLLGALATFRLPKSLPNSARKNLSIK